MQLERPTNLSDFDLRPGLAYLVKRNASPEQSVWTPSWWLNIACLLGACFLFVIAVVLLSNSQLTADDVADLSIGLQALAAVVALAGLATMTLLALGGVNRCRLVIDRSDSEIRITYGLWFWRSYKLRFADIRAIKTRMVENGGISDDGPGPGQRVVFAELISDELVLLAVDADFKKASLLRDIEESLATSRQNATCLKAMTA